MSTKQQDSKHIHQYLGRCWFCVWTACYPVTFHLWIACNAYDDNHSEKFLQLFLIKYWAARAQRKLSMYCRVYRFVCQTIVLSIWTSCWKILVERLLTCLEKATGWNDGSILGIIICVSTRVLYIRIIVTQLAVMSSSGISCMELLTQCMWTLSYWVLLLSRSYSQCWHENNFNLASNTIQSYTTTQLTKLRTWLTLTKLNKTWLKYL